MRALRSWLSMVGLLLLLSFALSASFVFAAAALPFSLRDDGNRARIYMLNRSGSRLMRVIELQPPSRVLLDLLLVTGGRYDEALCIPLNEAYLWERRSYVEELHAHLESDAYVTIRLDGQRLLMSSGDVYTQSLGTRTTILDFQNRPISSYSDLRYCLNAAWLDAGIHTAEIRFTTVSGRLHRHSWLFAISEPALILNPSPS